MSDYPPGQPHGTPQQPQQPPGYPPQQPPGYPPQQPPGNYGVGQQPPPGGYGYGQQPPPEPKKSWWKRKFWKLPVWAWIAIAVVLAAAATGGGGGNNSDEASDTTAATKATEAQTTDTVEAAPETTAPSAAGDTTAAPTVSTAAASTTEVTLTVDDVRQFVFPIVFDSARDGMIDILNDSGALQSVDKFEYDADNGTVVLSVTSIMRSEDNIRDEAWALTQIFAGLWTTDKWVNSDPAWAPNFDMTVSGLQYRCNAQQMIAMADTRFSRDDWESGCRVG